MSGYIGPKHRIALTDSFTKAQAEASFAPITRSRKNLLINGNFAINQREYVSGTATTSINQYTLDRFRVVVSGESLTFVASGNGNEVTAPAGGIEQVIEGANISGGTYTLSWQGTATATVDGAAVVNGGSVTLTANTNAVVRFSGGTVSRCQLEEGDTATDFEYRPIGQERALCWRYYQIFPFPQRSVVTASSATGFYVLTPPSKMRVGPAVTHDAVFVNTYTPTGKQLCLWGFGGVSRHDVTGINFTSISEATYIRADFSAALTQGQGYEIACALADTGPLMFLDAEL